MTGTPQTAAPLSAEDKVNPYMPGDDRYRDVAWQEGYEAATRARSGLDVGLREALDYLADFTYPQGHAATPAETKAENALQVIREALASSGEAAPREPSIDMRDEPPPMKVPPRPEPLRRQHRRSGEAAPTTCGECAMYSGTDEAPPPHDHPDGGGAAPVDGLQAAQLESYGDWLVENGLPEDRRAAAVQRAGLFALTGGI